MNLIINAAEVTRVCVACINPARGSLCRVKKSKETRAYKVRNSKGYALSIKDCSGYRPEEDYSFAVANARVV